MTGEQVLAALQAMSPTERSYPIVIPAVDEESPIGFEATAILVARTAFFTPDGDVKSGLSIFLE